MADFGIVLMVFHHVLPELIVAQLSPWNSQRDWFCLSKQNVNLVLLLYYEAMQKASVSLQWYSLNLEASSSMIPMNARSCSVWQ
jgi:hypothetical protein